MNRDPKSSIKNMFFIRQSLDFFFNSICFFMTYHSNIVVHNKKRQTTVLFDLFTQKSPYNLN